jgi:hypothetical protein
MCQRHTGALTAAWVEFLAEDVAWCGEGGAPQTYRSSEISSRAFCPQCGSAIGAIDNKPVIALLVSAFDKPNRRDLAPQYHSYRATRQRWWAVEVKEQWVFGGMAECCEIMDLCKGRCLRCAITRRSGYDQKLRLRTFTPLRWSSHQPDITQH